MALTVAPDEIINHRFRRGRSGKKDRLDKIAARAAAMGISYGQYMGLYREQLLPPAEMERAQSILSPSYMLPPSEEDEYEPSTEERPSKGANFHKNAAPRPCATCGKVFQPRANNGAYCCDACREVGKKKNAAAWKKQHRAEVMA